MQKAREQEGQPDADGWVLVTRHSKRPVARRSEGLDQRLREKMKKKRQRQQMVNLYNFQLKDTKMERELTGVGGRTRYRFRREASREGRVWDRLCAVLA